MSNNIVAIGEDTVHKICSGQVVQNLATALKELVENSLDAKATVIDVRLREFGSELIEVVDNGSGIHPDNFEALALKHYTSKLRDFSDLVDIETFGFRGEALSSLCAVGDLIIVTKHKSQLHGSKLTFDHMGVLKDKTPLARQVGSTVSLKNIFSSLPVRQKELHRNLKREFAKAVQLLSSYCLITTDVKITCINQTKKGGRMIFLSTQDNKSLRQNISCVFGSKQITNLLEIVHTKPCADLMDEFNISNEDVYNFNLEGYVSSCEHGCGRSSTDRQFFFINSRPCDMNKAMKLTNEIYHRFNSHQYPFVLLNIKLPKQSVDVNVTPDKRLIFFEHERALLATLKSSLIKTFESVPSTYRLNGPITSSPVESIQNAISVNPSTAFNLDIFDKNLSDRKRSIQKCLDAPRLKQRKLQDTLKSLVKTNAATKLNENNLFQSESNKDSFVVSKCTKAIFPSDISTFASNSQNSFSVEENRIKISSPSADREVDLFSSKCCDNMNISDNRKDEFYSKCFVSKNEVNDFRKSPTNESLNAQAKMICDISLHQIAQIFQTKLYNKNKELSLNRFHADIVPEKNSLAEEELKKEISKDMFQKMKIVGQFNLGFIITKLENDLFIVDQHACDEKYNFENLQRTTTLNNQKLIVPQDLNLTASYECILRDNIEIFRKNGFEFFIDDSAETTNKIKLASIPMSYQWQFGKDDVDEMLFMLQDAPLTLCRPTKVRSMFASRACRKSVMIGTHLNTSEMRKLINNMGCIEQPWNCPHGRPTMRHLVNLSLLK